MSAPDPSPFTAADLPRDPADYRPRRRGLPLSFWVMIAFGLVCIFAGVTIGLFGARLFPLKAAADSSAPAPAVAADAPMSAPIAASLAGQPASSAANDAAYGEDGFATVGDLAGRMVIVVWTPVADGGGSFR